jgi:hypothetical protein
MAAKAVRWPWMWLGVAAMLVLGAGAEWMIFR